MKASYLLTAHWFYVTHTIKSLGGYHNVPIYIWLTMKNGQESVNVMIQYFDNDLEAWPFTGFLKGHDGADPDATL